ncbi:glycosyltransferase family 32 protein [Gonapodya prolifera JEL478]|uniref:U3 small nucleolar RNA-associated protein 10 n=1 Tax=Gonapodya prolifera (strain JEL478) TaxID=1344416 RepID=A0A139A4V3_GONPJ|nr:glycosyltransferase family 32 protein [Gonapodya prolifera JEL478]|eukprot:KXS11658.1 glycosyltransferase family 32 protein [Gonapodya prolifera JEL478]
MQMRSLLAVLCLLNFLLFLHSRWSQRCSSVVSCDVEQPSDALSCDAEAQIPRLVHFIFGLSPDYGTKPFGIMHYLIIKAAHKHIRPEAIFFHHVHQPPGPWFERSRRYLHMAPVEPVNEIWGNPVDKFAHKADIVRLRALEQHGGIYLDIDALVLRPFDPLLRHDFVMAQEGEGGRVGLANAIMASKKGSPFVKRWLESYRTFNQTLWNYHSVVLPGKMAKSFPDDITILKHTRFFHPMWDDASLHTLFRGSGSGSWDFAENFAVHMWESRSFDKYIAPLSVRTIMRGTSNFDRILQSLIWDEIDELLEIEKQMVNNEPTLQLPGRLEKIQIARMSLAKQLRNVAAASRAGTSLHHGGGGRGKASLLFSVEQAADMDTDQVYAVGIAGLQELSSKYDPQELDASVLIAPGTPRFGAFEATLFSLALKNVDRSKQTKEENAKLDAGITSFLQLVSPYCLDMSAWKALEWLIRRFRIHEHNVEAFLGCVLPFHETDFFVKVVSILQISSNSRWSFLSTISKSKAPLTRPILVQRLITDISLLDYICTVVTRSLSNGESHHKVKRDQPLLWNFWTATMLSYARTVPQITTNILATILPHVFAFMKARVAPDLQAGAYVVFSTISMRTPLSNETLVAFLESASKHKSKGPVEGRALLAMVHVCQNQEGLDVFPMVALRNLFRVESLVERIGTIISSYNATRFLKLFIAQLYRFAKETRRTELLVNLLQLPNFPRSVMESFVQQVVKDLISQTEEEGGSTLSEPIPTLIHLFNTRYPEELQEALKVVLDIPDNRSQQNRIFKFLGGTLAGTRYAAGMIPVENGSAEATPMFLGLRHPDPSVRIISVKQLDGLVGKGEVQEPEFVEDALLSLLSDSDSSVVKAVLSIDNLPRLVADREKLMQSLSTILEASAGSPNVPSLALAVILQVLAVAPQNFYLQYSHLILRHLLVTDKESRKIAIKLLGGLSAHENESGLFWKLMKGVSRNASLLKPSSDVDDGNRKIGTGKLSTSTSKYNNKVTDVLSENLVGLIGNNDFEIATNMYLECLKGTNTPLSCLASLVLGKCAVSVCARSRDHGFTFSRQTLPSVIGRFEIVAGAAFQVDAALMESTLTELFDKLEPFDSRVVYLLSSKVMIQQLGSLIGNANASENVIAVVVFKAIMRFEYLKSVELLLQTLFKECVGTADVVSFVVHVSLVHGGFDDVDDATVLLHTRCLQIVSHYVSLKPEHDYQMVVPWLLIFATSEIKNIGSTLNALKTLTLPGKGSSKANSLSRVYGLNSMYGKNESDHQISHLTTQEYIRIITWIESASSEIILDSQYLKNAMHGLLSPSKAGDDVKLARHTLAFLTSHLVHFPSRMAQLKLLDTLSKAHSLQKFNSLYSVMSHVLKSQEQYSSQDIDFLVAILQCVHPSSLNVSDDGAFLDEFCRILRRERVPSSPAAALQQCAISILSPIFFAEIDSEGQTIIYQTLLNVITWGGDANTTKLTKRVLKDLPLSSDTISSEFVSCLSVLPAVQLQVSKKRKESGVNATVGSSSRSPEQLVTALECANFLTMDEDPTPIFAALFDVLAALVIAEPSQYSISIEYCRQLCLSAIFTLADSQAPGTVENVSDSAIRLDTVVQSLRVTDNPQTHNSALLLLARLAQLNPHRVLNTVMPVFTFLGTNLVRQDDDYSFHVIHKTIETVLPALVQPREAQTSEWEDIVFKKNTLKWNAKVLVPNAANDDLSEFASSLAASFDVRIQLNGVVSLLEKLNVIPCAKPSSEEEIDALPQLLFDLRSHDDRDYREFRNLVTNFSSKVLSDKTFIKQFRAERGASKGSEREMDPIVLRLVEVLLSLIAAVEQHLSSLKGSDGTVVRFWKGVSKTTISLLDKAHRLLSPNSFLKVVSRLIRHENTTIRRKAITLVSEQIAEDEMRFSNASAKVFQEVFDEVMKIIKDEGAIDQNVALSKQVAMICVSTMATKMAKVDPSMFLDALPSLIGPGALSAPNDQVVASAMVAIAALTMELEARVLPFVGKYLPVVVSHLRASLNTTVSSSNSTMVQLSALGSMTVTVRTLPRFVGPYLQDLVQSSLHKSLLFENGGSQVRSKALEFRKAVAAEVPSRILVPVLCAQWKLCSDYGSDSLVALLDFVEMAIGSIPNDLLDELVKSLFKFLMGALNAACTQANVDDGLGPVGERSIATFLTFVMRLNESQFRPLYFKLVQWVTEINKNEETAHARCLVFFKLVDQLLLNLQAIFVPFVGYTLDPALNTLKAYRSGKLPDALWCCIVDCFQKTFQYDANGFVDKPIFDRLMQPLVDQLELPLTGQDEYSSAVHRHLIPAIAQLSLAATGDVYWKPLNHSVLLKTRSPLPHVRIAAIRTIQQFYSRHGEDFLSLLPETVPFLAELLEDEDESVEAVCREVCKGIENVLGEDLMGYLNK